MRKIKILHLFFLVIAILCMFPSLVNAQIPSDTSEYANWKSGLPVPSGALTDPRNDYIYVNVESGGRFTAGTVYGDGNPATPNDNWRNLMYGWSPWSSYTTFLVDGQPMIFPFGDVIDAPHDVDNETNVATYKYKDLVITQTIKLIRGPSSGQKDNFKVSYSVTNTCPDKSTIDKNSYYVGARIMLDTMVGYNDGAPFRVPGVGSVTKEKSLELASVPNYWQAYDNLSSPTLASQGTLVSLDSPKPTKIVFANWWKLYSNSWSYNPDYSNISDSAVAIYWEPVNFTSPNGYKIAPGETQTFETYYGLGSFAQSKGNISLIASGDSNLQLTNYGEYFPNPFMANALITNQDVLPQDVTVSINLPDGITNDISTPQLKTYTLQPGETQSIAWQLHATPESEDRTLQYSIKVSIGGAEVNSATRSVFLPKYNKKLVIFIPGAMGSSLERPNGDEVWLPEYHNPIGDLSYLQLSDSGLVDPNRTVNATEPLPEFYGLGQGWGIDYLKQTGFIVEPFAYDWRLSNWDVTAQKLQEFIDRKTREYGVNKVDIVVHSMGGIVTKSYLAKYGNVKVGKVIFIGTPHLGSPDTMYILRTGDVKDTLFNPITQPLMKSIAKNSPAVYELMPSKKFFEAYKDQGLNYYYNEETDTNGDGYASGKIDSWESMNNWLMTAANSDRTDNIMKGDLNGGLISKNLIHDEIDDAAYAMIGVDYYIIAGQNMGTLGSMRDYTTWHWNMEAGEYLPDTTTDINFINGDITVPLLSGTWNGAAGDHTYYITAKHSNLFKQRGIIEQIENILNNHPNQVGTGITRQKSNLEGYAITINSPVSMGIQTANGYVGPDNEGNIITEDQNVNYLKVDHNKFAFVPGTDPFNIILKGEAEGTFSLTISHVLNDQVVESAKFIDVPVSLGDQVTAVTGPSLGSIKLNIDRKADGSIDTTISPKVLTQSQLEDTTGPIFSNEIIGQKGQNDWYQSDVSVNLYASDNGSGVEKILFSINNSPGTYTQPLTISREGINKFWAVAKDKNENYSIPLDVQIKVDKTPPNINCDVQQFYALQSPFQIQYTADDSVSGLSNVQAWINGTSVKNGDTINLAKLGTNELKITAIDLAGNTRTLTKYFEVYLPVNILLDPNHINLDGSGEISAFLFLPSAYPTIPISGSVSLEGVLAQKDDFINPNKQIFKFNRSELAKVVPKGDSVPVTLTGYTGSYYIKGTTVLSVK